jgi:hypothetical protein
MVFTGEYWSGADMKGITAANADFSYGWFGPSPDWTPYYVNDDEDAGAWRRFLESYYDNIGRGDNARTKLDAVSFRSANLTDASFEGAYLMVVDFREAEFGPATNFAGANLFGANFRGAKGLTCEQLRTGVLWEYSFRDADVCSNERESTREPSIYGMQQGVAKNWKEFNAKFERCGFERHS